MSKLFAHASARRTEFNWTNTAIFEDANGFQMHRCLCVCELSYAKSALLFTVRFTPLEECLHCSQPRGS